MSSKIFSTIYGVCTVIPRIDARKRCKIDVKKCVYYATPKLVKNSNY
jgi:hypothetical protein